MYTKSACASMNNGSSFKDGARFNCIPTSSASSAYSISISYNVSIWSDVNAIGTASTFLWPCAAKPLIPSPVCGPSHGNGPTCDCHAMIYLLL